MTGERQLTMIVGSGRSGTSVLAILLRELGYRVPQPEVPPDETNPKGFGESQWLVEFHRELHKASLVQNSDARPSAFADTVATITQQSEYVTRAIEWLAPHFDENDFVLLKDPRMVWFTTLWESAAIELGASPTYLTPLRHPTEIVASKQSWYESAHTAVNHTAGWINGVLHAERASRGHRRGFVTFDTLLTDWVGAVTSLDEQADLPPVRRGLTRAYRDADTYVDPSLRRSAAAWDELGVPPVLVDLAERTWAELCLLPSAEGPADRRDEQLDQLRREYGELYAWSEAMTQSTAIAARRAGVQDGRRRERRRQRRAGGGSGSDGRSETTTLERHPETSPIAPDSDVAATASQPTAARLAGLARRSMGTVRRTLAGRRGQRASDR